MARRTTVQEDRRRGAHAHQGLGPLQQRVRGPSAKAHDGGPARERLRQALRTLLFRLLLRVPAAGERALVQALRELLRLKSDPSLRNIAMECVIQLSLAPGVEIAPDGDDLKVRS